MRPMLQRGSVCSSNTLALLVINIKLQQAPCCVLPAASQPLVHLCSLSAPALR